MRIWPAATFTSWLSDTFALMAVQRLGGPVYVACWVGPKYQSYVEHSLTLAMQRRVAEVGFHPMFFEKEPDARAWLLHQQAHDAGQRQAAYVLS